MKLIYNIYLYRILLSGILSINWTLNLFASVKLPMASRRLFKYKTINKCQLKKKERNQIESFSLFLSATVFIKTLSYYP